MNHVLTDRISWDTEMHIKKTLQGDKQHNLPVSHFSFEQLPPGNTAGAERLMQIAALRYEVYCLERGFLDPEDYPAEVELDEYDSRSMHAAAFMPDGRLIAAVRLVLATGGQRYPFEKHCSVFEDFSFPPREQCGEVSRLVVRKNFRRRPGDSKQGITKEFRELGKPVDAASSHGPTSRERRSNSPEILLGLYREMYRFSRQNGIRYWFSAMERALLRSMSRIGFKFIPIGPGTDYYGPVTPFMSDLNEFKVTTENHGLLL